MSLIHGSRGLIYFVHEFKPRFNEHALLDDPEMLTAVTGINRQIRSLAPVINSPSVSNGAKVVPSDANIRVAVATKFYQGVTYVFAVGMRNGHTKASLGVPSIPKTARAEVLGENRTITVKGGKFEDAFAPYDVHLYRIY
jgi:hypothetical protein